MKRQILFIFPLLALLLMTGCTPVPEGYGEIRQAKKLYEALDSARVVMLDDRSGEPLMDFSFYINKKDEMVFSYESYENGEMAYSDGRQFFYRTESDGGWTAITPKNEEYIYNIYNRKYRYPYARGALFFVDADSVSSAEITRDGGDTLISYVYDCEKLNGRAVSKLENVTAFSALTCVYRINSDGYITEFTETGALTDENGAQRNIDTTYRVMEMNAISVIENPVDHILSE